MTLLVAYDRFSNRMFVGALLAKMHK